MTDAIKGTWAADYLGWDTAFRPLFDALATTRVRVLMWGPGEGWPFYAKRIQIRDHLRSDNAYNEVLTSEEMEERYAEFKGMNPQDAESFQVDVADAIILLLVKETRVTGVQTEVSLFRNDPEFYAKARLLKPKLNPAEKRKLNRAASFLTRGWLDYPDEHCFVYTQAEYDDCTKMRDYCSEFVNRIRRQLVHKERMARKYGSAP